LKRLLVLGLLLACGSAEAQQIDFKRTSRSGDEQLSYRWRDAGRHEYSTAFTLTKAEIAQSEASFRDFSLDAMWRSLEADLRDETEKFGEGARILLSRTRGGLTWRIEAPDQPTADALMAETKARLARSENDYLALHLRRRVDGRRIIVDFAAATAALQEPMAALARALGATPHVADSDRARIALALAFFQEVPYAVLEDKERRGGDFLPAPALLAQNRGDCDSKAVALAAVLRTYVPGRKLAVITMPEHAILAVDMPAEPGDWTIRASGRQYVALEASGPALAAIGQVGPLTAKYLKDARETEIWPLN
jgi:hypothetical protein